MYISHFFLNEAQSSTRSEKEERRLWRMLEESDREHSKELERISKKAAKKVNQARTRMGAGKCQPGIADMFKSVDAIANSWKSSKTAEFITRSNRLVLCPQEY